jgi:hypothetical protein
MDSSSTLYLDHEIGPTYMCVGTWRSKFEGMPRTAYVDIDQEAEGWSNFAVYFSGASPSNNQAILQTEIVINAEVHPMLDNVFTQGASKASPDVPAIQSIAANLVPNMPDVIQTTSPDQRSVWDYVSSAVESFAGVAGPLAVEALVAML